MGEREGVCLIYIVLYIHRLKRAHTHTLTHTHSHTHTHTATQHESLPLAPPPEPRQLTPRELQKIDKQRSSVLRELRIFLREATNKLMAERKFKEFTRPVDPEEVGLVLYQVVLNRYAHTLYVHCTLWNSIDTYIVHNIHVI